MWPTSRSRRRCILRMRRASSAEATPISRILRGALSHAHRAEYMITLPRRFRSMRGELQMVKWTRGFNRKTVLLVTNNKRWVREAQRHAILGKFLFVVWRRPNAKRCLLSRFDQGQSRRQRSAYVSGRSHQPQFAAWRQRGSPVGARRAAQQEARCGSDKDYRPGSLTVGRGWRRVRGTPPGMQTWESDAYETEVVEADNTDAAGDQLRHAKDQLTMLVGIRAVSAVFQAPKSLRSTQPSDKLRVN